ncbi:hypothetical protein NHP164001_06230 [Helicobacter trogontum]|uniref:Uncharacterized protein n=1 Tax=Helicobacter trogontum TaxID=50960 RepID=A0ABQ0D2P7_9HELI|nr:hypothetical protein [Helicobacter trogontum]
MSVVLISALGFNFAHAGQKGGIFAGLTGGLNFNTVKKDLTIVNTGLTATSMSVSSRGN